MVGSYGLRVYKMGGEGDHQAYFPPGSDPGYADGYTVQRTFEPHLQGNTMTAPGFSYHFTNTNFTPNLPTSPSWYQDQVTAAEGSFQATTNNSTLSMHSPPTSSLTPISAFAELATQSPGPYSETTANYQVQQPTATWNASGMHYDLQGLASPQLPGNLPYQNMNFENDIQFALQPSEGVDHFTQPMNTGQVAGFVTNTLNTNTHAPNLPLPPPSEPNANPSTPEEAFQEEGRSSRIPAREQRKKEPPIPCPNCGKKFPYKSEMERHRRSVHEKGRDYVCDICEKSYTRDDHLRRHQTQKHGRPPRDRHAPRRRKR